MNPVAGRHTGWKTAAAADDWTKCFWCWDRDTRAPRKNPVGDVLMAPVSKASLLTRAILLGRAGGEIFFSRSMS
jgi:hypothetical protein